MSSTQVATFAGGCFWCIESAFNQVQGIIKATSGYMGGHVVNPSYEQVCKGDTGHAEVVQLEFDADEISYRDLLEIFFSLHNPTQLNRQGDDVGEQYRTEIFYHNEQQQLAAEQIIAEIARDNIWPDPIVTKVTAVTDFYSAEAYHQEYFNNNPENQYCQLVVSPKLAKFKKTFVSKLKA